MLPHNREREDRQGTPSISATEPPLRLEGLLVYWQERTPYPQFLWLVSDR